MDSLLSDAFAVSGRGRTELEKTCRYIDGHTRLEKIFPQDIGFISVLTPPDSRGGFETVHIEPGDGSSSIFVERNSVGKYRHMSRGGLYKHGLTEELQQEFFDVGFMLWRHFDNRSEMLLASKIFFEELVPLLGTKAPPGQDPMRDLYLMSLMLKAKPVQVLIRSDETSESAGKMLNKAFACGPKTAAVEKHEVMHRAKPAFDARFGLTRIGGWTVTQERASVEYLVSEDFFRGTMLRRGYEFSFSDTFCGSFKLQPFVGVGSDVAYIGNPYCKTLVSGAFDAEELAGMVDLSRLASIDEKIGAMMRPVNDVWHCVERLSAETGVEALLGPTAFGNLKNKYQVPSQTDDKRFMDAVIMMMQLSTLSGIKATDRTKERFRYAAGRAFDVFPEILEEEKI